MEGKLNATVAKALEKYPKNKPKSKRENQQQTQPTRDADAGIWIQATDWETSALANGPP